MTRAPKVVWLCRVASPSPYLSSPNSGSLVGCGGGSGVGPVGRKLALVVSAFRALWVAVVGSGLVAQRHVKTMVGVYGVLGV